MAQSPVHETMRRLTKALDDLDLPFAIAGAMALNAHGHRRTTAEVDVVTTRDDLERFLQLRIGHEWVNRAGSSRSFRDAATGIDVDILLTGDFPGDGLPKPVTFPMPGSVSVRGDENIPYVNLDTLLELKLASGMTAIQRPRDLDDVIQLIRANKLPPNHAEELNEYVHAKYLELWHFAQIVEEY